MVPNYNISERFVAYILLLGLFFQSCTNSSKQLNPILEKTTSNNLRTSKSNPTQQLTSQEFTTEQQYIVDFNENNQSLKVDEEAEISQLPIYKGLPVTIEKDTNLVDLTHLNPPIQQPHIEIQTPEHIQSPNRVTTLKEYLLDETKNNIIKEGEKEKKTEESDREDVVLDDLLDCAKSGNIRAQSELDEMLYEAAQQYQEQGDKLQEAKKILEKGVAYGHKLAITLLQELPPLLQDYRAKKFESKGKEKELEPNTSELALKELLNSEMPSYLHELSFNSLKEDNQQEELKKRIISLLDQPAYHQRIKLEIYKHLGSPTFSEEQHKSIPELIKLIVAPEKRLRLGRSHEIRESFRAKPTQDHNLFDPLRMDVQKLESYKQKFPNTIIEILIGELIHKYQEFIVKLTEKVKNLGPTAPLKLFEEKPLLQGESFDYYEVKADKAYEIACYNPNQYEYIRSNSSGLSIGSMQGGVYFKIDNEAGLLRPAKEHAIYSLYQALGLGHLISPTQLVVMNGLSVLPPDIGQSPERRKLLRKKQKLQTFSTQDVFNHYPKLEHRIQVAQKERSLFIQGSLVVPGKTLEKFLEKAEESSDLDLFIQQLDTKSFSGHVLASLLTLPTDYKPDNLIVDEQNRIIGIDNDAALEAGELRRLHSSNKHLVSIKNILYLLPLMHSPVDITIQERFIQHHPGLFLLNWLVTLQDKQPYYDYLLITSLVDNQNASKIKKYAEDSLGLPLQFCPGWIVGMYDRFVKIQALLRSNPTITHGELFEQIHPFASRYYKTVKKLFPQPLDQIAFIYEKRSKNFSTTASSDFEYFITQYPELGDEELLAKLSQTHFILQDPSLSIQQAMQELITITDLKDYEPDQQLAWIERVTKIGIWPTTLHESWYDSLLLIRMIQEGASNQVIKSLIEKADANIHACDEASETVLHAAVRRGGKDALRQIPVLIKLGADKEAQANRTLVTPLDVAAEERDLDVFKLLIDLGAGEKVIPNKINRFYKKLSVKEKEDLIAHITRLTQINPKVGWEISLDEIFPLQGNAKAVLKTVTEGDRVLTEEACDKLFEVNGRPKKENTYGVRSVPFLEKNGQRIYVKFYPQLPGTELAVTHLAESLLGYCTPYCELASIGDIPVLLTQGVPGETLYEVLKNHPERLSQLDPESVSKALILAMLINPGDGNLGNYIVSPFTNSEGEVRYRLISIDNDQAFMPAIARSIKTGLWGSTLSLQVKTILYCLEVIKSPVSPALIKLIQQKDLIEMLNSWLSMLRIHHEAAKNHFNSALLKKYQKWKTTVIGVTFAPGMIKQLFTKLMRLQTALNKKTPPTHFELLEILEPFVADRYSPVIYNSRLSTIEKFKKVEHITEEHALYSSINVLSNLLISREVPEFEKLQSDLWSGKYDPDHALQELQVIKEEHTSLQQIFKDLGNLKVQDLKNLPTGLLEGWLREVDLTKLSDPQQKILLGIIQDQDLRYICLKNSTTMTGNWLPYFKLEYIKKLNLLGCTNLGAMSAGILGNYPLIMPALTHLIVEASGITFIRLQANQLKKLNARSCTKLKSIDLIAPHLNMLDLRGAVGLSEEVIKSFFVQFPNTQIYLIPITTFSNPQCANYLYQQGSVHLNKNNYLLAAHYLKQSAEQGNNKAYPALRKLIIKNNSNHNIKNNNKAQSWMIEQAEKGDEKARDSIYKIGSIYEQGIGIEKNEAKATEWYIRADTQGHQHAPASLIILALKGIELAQQWLSKKPKKSEEIMHGIIDLTSNQIDAKKVTKLAEALPNTQAHTLNLSNNQIGDIGTDNLAQALPNTQIVMLNLSDNQIGDEGANKLAVNLSNTMIHILNLSVNQIGIEGTSKLAEALVNTQIHTFDLSSNQIGAKGISKLAEALPNTKVHTITLWDNQIGAEGTSKLAEVLPNTNIHTLDLRSNNIGDIGAGKLAKALPNTNIHTLNLTNNQISYKGVTKLAQALPNTEIHTLDLSWNKIGDKGVIKLAKGLSNSHIHTLGLSLNSIGDEGASKLAKILPNTKIITLNLWNNEIGDKGASNLAETLPNTKINSLDLSKNKIGDSGISKLAEALPNTKINSLDLSKNKISDKGTSKLAEFLVNTQIHTLYLNGNQISVKGAKKLAKALLNTKVHTLDLHSNQIGSKGANKLAQALPNTEIHTLDLSLNQIGDVGTINLANFLANMQLNSLNLSWNQISAEGARMLVGVLPNTQINTLNLSDNQIGDKGASKLAKVLPNTLIYVLDLRSNKIGDKGANKLVRALPNTKIRTFDLRSNQISSEMQLLLRQQNPGIEFIF